MKINLKKFIKEEVQQALKEMDRETFLNIDPDITKAVMIIANNDGDLYRAYQSGKMTAKEVVTKAAHMYLKTKIEGLKDDLFNKKQMEHMVKEYEDYYKAPKKQPIF